MPLIIRVREFAAQHRLWRPDTRVIAAVSGGSDSVAMLVLLRELHRQGHVHLDAVAHLNHAIRPAAADDQEFTAALASRFGLPFVTTTVDVRRLAEQKRLSIELSARVARRRFLEGVRRERGADVVATAHTEDDQAETVLLRVMRGTGTHGIGGIAPMRGRLIRPVLCATRDELRSELLARAEPWREDLTNADVENPRNRVRHELLPYMQRHFNPSVRRALARLADVARADETWLLRQATAAGLNVVETADGHVQLDRREVGRLAEAIARRVFRRALTLAGHQQPTLDDVQAVADVASGERRAVELREVRVEPFGDFVVLLARASSDPPPPFRFVLEVPGVLQVEAAGWVLEACSSSTRPERDSSDAAVAQIDASSVGNALIVRRREPGDRVRVAGLGGSKKVQDVFVDSKVPRRERDRIPIVTHTDGRIVWVAGQVIGEEFRVTDRTKAVITLKIRRI